MTTWTASAGAAALALALLAGAAPAQAPQPKKTTLQETAFPGHGLHTVLVRTELAPGGAVPRHTHPGLESCYVVQGEAVAQIEGRPEQRLGPGGSYFAAPGQPHSIRNAGRGPLVLVSTYVVDPAKPIASPAG